MSDKPELKPCQNTKCALHGNKGNKCLYWGDDADVESCCCYSADLAKPSEWIERKAKAFDWFVAEMMDEELEILMGKGGYKTPLEAVEKAMAEPSPPDKE